MNGLSKLRDRLTVGTVLTCLENTRFEYRNGAQAAVTGMTDRYVGVHGVAAGNSYSIELPRRADIEWIDTDTVRWPLGIAAHTVTYKIGTGG